MWCENVWGMWHVCVWEGGVGVWVWQVGVCVCVYSGEVQCVGCVCVGVVWFRTQALPACWGRPCSACRGRCGGGGSTALQVKYGNAAAGSVGYGRSHVGEGRRRCRRYSCGETSARAHSETYVSP